jgi:photosystem II stability/assembly factor-like uncharacterized protein
MHGARLNDEGTRLYAISANGGVWRADPAGNNWTPIGDDLYGGAQLMTVLPDDVVLVGTDWGSVHRTDDDGASWTVPTNLDGWNQVRRIARMTDGSDTVFVVGGPTNNYGIWRSQDGGASFTRVYDLGAWLGDVWVPRTGSGTVYALSGSGTLRSSDHGDSWQVVGPAPDADQNAMLVGSEAGAPTLYSAAVDGYSWRGWRSDDAGATWNDLGVLSDFYGEIEAGILDPNLFAWGGVDLSISRDGGQTSSKINTWDQYYGDPASYLHADIMGMQVQATDTGEVWWIGCDGGLYRSDDSLRTVQNLSLSGLRVSQYYSTLTSTADPLHVQAGAQDQGYQVTQGGDTTAARWGFVQALSGDYGHLSSGDGTHQRVISTYPGFILVANGEETVSLDYTYFPSGATNAWLPPVVVDPDDVDVFYFLAEHLYRYEHKPKQGWQVEQASDQSFAQTPYEYLTALAFAPTDHERAYAVTNYGRTFVSDDHGVTWTAGGGMAADAHYFYGNAIAVSPTDADTA